MTGFRPNHHRLRLDATLTFAARRNGSRLDAFSKSEIFSRGNDGRRHSNKTAIPVKHREIHHLRLLHTKEGSSSWRSRRSQSTDQRSTWFFFFFFRASIPLKQLDRN